MKYQFSIDPDNPVPTWQGGLGYCFDQWDIAYMCTRRPIKSVYIQAWPSTNYSINSESWHDRAIRRDMMEADHEPC